MASMTGTRRIVITTVILVAASAVFGVVMLASRPMSSTMAGMDMSGSSPAPASADHGGMPGMDMSGSSGGASVHRPLAPVLGTFGGGSAAVLLTAGMMRRKDRAAGLAKKAARAADRSGK